MKHKVGDKVRIKSIDWYNENKDESGNLEVNDLLFSKGMAQYCGKEGIITEIDGKDGTFRVNLDDGCWFDEGMVEEIPDTNSTSDTFQEIADTIRKIAEIIRQENIGLSVKEQDGGIIILPCKDLPVNTPVMVSDNASIWELRYYSGGCRTFINGYKSSEYDRTVPWKYIVPFSQFDPENIEESLKHNIVSKDFAQ